MSCFERAGCSLLQFFQFLIIKILDLDVDLDPVSSIWIRIIVFFRSTLEKAPKVFTNLQNKILFIYLNNSYFFVRFLFFEQEFRL